MGLSPVATSSWPVTAAARDTFVLSRRPARRAKDPWSAPRVLMEEERAPDGATVRSATILLTGRECPWRCVMCDLWSNTIDADTPPGALPAQVRLARGEFGGSPPAQVKLYNAGSFFDPRAVPESDYGDIARSVAGIPRVIVESHPLLVGSRLRRWREALERAAVDGPPPSLEVAIGLETAHPLALERLHKRFSIDDFARAADRVLEAGAALRVFLLVGVPFIAPEGQLDWVRRSADYAFNQGASVVSLISTRPGNGALEALAAEGRFVRPVLGELERAMDAVLPEAQGRVFADVWDLDACARCAACLPPRHARLHTMNLTQHVLPHVACAGCSLPEAHA